MLLERLMTTIVLLLTDVLLVKLTRSTGREFGAAVKTAALVSTGDVVVESAAGHLGLWTYDLPGSVAGLPVDLAPDIGLLSFAYCTGLSYIDEKPSWRRFRPLYVIGTALLISTEGWLKNARAARQGRLAFAVEPASRPALFAFSNFAVLSLFVLAVTALHTTLIKRFDERQDR